MMNRRQLLHQLAAAGLLSAGGTMGFLQRALANGEHPAQPGLRKLKGQVSINGQPAKEGQEVGPGDRVATGSDAEAVYVIHQDAFLQRGGSTVEFGRSAQDFMRVLSGRILSVFGKGERKLKFSTATIGIRGTACYIEEKVGPDGTANERARSYFCLCYGEAEVIPIAAPQERTVIRTTYHDNPLYISDDMKMPARLVAAPVINHTDAELVLLENLVGRWPSFYGETNSRY
jgi:hypothetical protein